jgi:hypothetical protein
MSWRGGSKLFTEMWPLIQTAIPDRGYRIDFTARLLQILVDDDMDPYDVEDVHADVRAALRKIGVDLPQSELFPDDADEA